MKYRNLNFETRQIHAGLDKNDPTCSRGAAIYPTAAYRFPTCGYAADLFELSQPGNIYTRLHNPTTSAYEERVAALYGAPAALATSSGMAAVLTAITSLAKAGDNIVASPFLYGGTYNQFRHTLRRFGIEVRIAASTDRAGFEHLTDRSTRAVFAESMGNPTCDVADIEGIGQLAKENGIPFIIDNTFGACGYLCNPLEWGANIVVDSATKWINGHGTAMGEIIVDGGNFDWSGFPGIDSPSEGYHGVNFHKAFGETAFIVRLHTGDTQPRGILRQ